MMRGRGCSHYHHDYRPHSNQLHPDRRPTRTQFTVLLKRPSSKDSKPLNPRAIDDLIDSLPSPPQEPLVFPSSGGFHGGSNIAAKLVFYNSDDALDAIAFLWRRRLGGAHLLIPVVVGAQGYPTLVAEQLRLVKQILIGHVESVLNGEIVSKCEKRVEELEREIEGKRHLLGRRRNSVNVCTKLLEGKNRLQVELEQVNGKLEEFRTSMKSILGFLSEGKDRVLADGEFDVFKFGKDLYLQGMVRIHSMVMRECRRLSDGLPIYACRRKILQTMFSNQVTVIIGETGCGKSTQLVQFIADSGLASTGSVVCTQPRKIAVLSIAQRIMEESIGCYDDDSVVSYLSYSSCQKFNSKIMFMTDHCLLQYYMREKNFEGISCIIIDEAHERSLNTDLLLALIKKVLLYSELRVIFYCQRKRCTSHMQTKKP